MYFSWKDISPTKSTFLLSQNNNQGIVSVALMCGPGLQILYVFFLRRIYVRQVTLLLVQTSNQGIFLFTYKMIVIGNKTFASTKVRILSDMGKFRSDDQLLFVRTL